MVGVRQRKGQHGTWRGPPGVAILQPGPPATGTGGPAGRGLCPVHSKKTPDTCNAGVGFPAAIGYCWTMALAN